MNGLNLFTAFTIAKRRGMMAFLLNSIKHVGLLLAIALLGVQMNDLQ